MASNNLFTKMFKVFRCLPATNRVVLPTVCVACGSAVVYFSSVKSNVALPEWARFLKPKEVYAASTSHHHQNNAVSDVSS